MAQNMRIIDVLKEIGFADGFHIPVANEENQSIEKEIKELLQKKAEFLLIEESLDNELREKNDRIINLSNYKTQNQKLILANRQKYEIDQHLLITAQRENDNLIRENKEAAKKLNKLIESQSKLEEELAKHDEKIKKLKETIEWGEETLLAWNNDLAKRNNDVNLLETYNLEDNKRFKELDVRRKHLQLDVIERESILEKEINELLQVERELDKTSQLIRQAQGERSHLLEQWEDTANFLNSNQRDIQNTVEEINRVKEAAREINEKMNENKQIYQDRLEANEEIELELNETIKDNNELKLMIRNKLTENENLQSEILAAQVALNNLGNTLANERTKHKHLQNEITKLKTQIHKKTEDMTKIKEKLTKIKNQSMTTEERLHEFDNIYDDQKATAERLLSDKEKVKRITLNVKNETKQIQSKINLMNHQLERNRNKQSAFNKEESKLRQLIMEKKEELYNLSFQLETIHIKIAEVEGTVDTGEIDNLQDKLQMLNEELQQAKYEKHKLEKQLKSLDNESRRIVKEAEKTNVELETLRNRGEELRVLNEGVIKQIQTLKEQCHRYHMEEMMLRLKVEQMKKLTNNECEKVYSLAQQREELNANINNRKAEVAAIREHMNAEKKLLLEEKSSVKRELDATMQRIEQRRNRYEILLATVPGTTENDDRSFSISEHRIRVTQEKLELQDTGDQLDERVQKLENEIRAMENTLHVLNATNSCYKSNLSSVNPASNEYKQKISLDEEYEQANSMWLQKKKILEKIKNEIQNLEDKYKTSMEDLDSLINVRDLKNIEFERGLKDIDEQLLKINRVDNRIQFDVKKIEKSCNDAEKRSAFELIKQDITVRMMKKSNKTVLELLSEMAVRHIGLEPTIKQYLSEKELKMPNVSSLLSLSKVKSNCSSSAVSLISNSSCTNSHSDDDKKSSYSVVNLGSNALRKSTRISDNRYNESTQ